MFVEFNTYGLSYLINSYDLVMMRPLHLVASALQWLVGAGSVAGVSITAGVFVLAIYLSGRWAAKPLISGAYLWIFATLSASLLIWPGSFLGRFHSAQLATIFFCIAVGSLIRYKKADRIKYAIFCVVFVFLMLMTYQSLALCALLLPLITYFCCSRDFEKSKLGQLKIILLLYIPISIGFVVYAAYLFFAFSYINPQGDGSYELSLVSGLSLSQHMYSFVFHVTGAYQTAYVYNLTVLPIFLIILIYIAVFASGSEALRDDAYKYVLIAVVGFLLLPMLSLVYVSPLHIGDIDRVLHPVSVGFLLIALIFLHLASMSRSESEVRVIYKSIPLILFIVIIQFVSAFQIQAYSRIQGYVIQDLLKEINNSVVTKSIIIRDNTGVLGDVYTLLNPVLGDVLRYHGYDYDVLICTPKEVLRRHPISLRFPIISTPDCGYDLKSSSQALVLEASHDNSAVRLRRL